MKISTETEVVLIINCIEGQLEMVKDILWLHNALGVRKPDIDNTDHEKAQ